MRIARQPNAGFCSAKVRKCLIAADVESAEYDRFAAGLSQNGAIGRYLAIEPRKGLRQHELQLGSEQADAIGARFLQMRHVDEEPGIHVKADAHAILGQCRDVAQRFVLLLPAGAEADLIGEG